MRDGRCAFDDPIEHSSVTVSYSFARNAYAPLEGRVKETETQEVDLAFAIWSLGAFKIGRNFFRLEEFFSARIFPFCDLIDSDTEKSMNTFV